MNALDLKDEILAMLARVKDEPTLQEILEFVAHAVSDTEGHAGHDWNENLSPEQVADLELALEEINDPANLVSHDEALKRIGSWRSK